MKFCALKMKALCRSWSLPLQVTMNLFRCGIFDDLMDYILVRRHNGFGSFWSSREDCRLVQQVQHVDACRCCMGRWVFLNPQLTSLEKYFLHTIRWRLDVSKIQKASQRNRKVRISFLSSDDEFKNRLIAKTTGWASRSYHLFLFCQHAWIIHFPVSLTSTSGLFANVLFLFCS